MNMNIIYFGLNSNRSFMSGKKNPHTIIGLYNIHVD